MTHVTCRLTAKDRDQIRNPTLGSRANGLLLPLTSNRLQPRRPHRR